MASLWLAATAAGAVAGAVAGSAVGGIVGAMVESGVPEDDANFFAESIRRGGSVMTARVEDGHRASAEAILSSSPRVNVAERRSLYTEQGWTRFDDTADPYTDEQIAAERDRYRVNRL